jgi:general secretion pathway protein J
VNARRQSGFTLIELVVAMVLLGIMMLLLYSGLTFALRSWDAGEANGRNTVDRRIGENFLRRELTELFPMRWKDPMTLKFAFEGEKQRLRFVSSRAAGATVGGISLVGLEVEPDAGNPKARHLTMRRAMPDDEAKDFAPLDRAERTVLIADVETATFEYFGSENDFTESKWSDSWTYPGRMPQMVRLRVKTADGTALPDFVVRMVLGEEAGCLENSFQRVCRPRRPGPV